MNLPTKIKVACYDIAVEDWSKKEADAAGQYGEFSFQDLVIKVTTEGQANTTIADTFIHEIMHAVYCIYHIRDKDKEERTVTTLSTGMTQVYRDNPEVLQFIKEMLK